MTVTALGGTSNAKPYTYDSGPSLTSLTPTAGKLAGGTTVTLTGSNFVTGATVAFGTMPGTTVQVFPHPDHRQDPAARGRDRHSDRDHPRRLVQRQAIHLRPGADPHQGHTDRRQDRRRHNRSP